MTALEKDTVLRDGEGEERVHSRHPGSTRSSLPRASSPGAKRRPVEAVKAAKTPLALRLAQIVGLLTLLLIGALMVAAHGYYEVPIAGRVRQAWHPWLKPSGIVGQALGLYALGLFLFLWLYPLRKKLGRRVERIGPIPLWLDVHIIAGLLVPLVSAVHAGWRFRGLIGLGYLSMFVVCLSGVVGRYLYIHIPRGRNGVALTLDEVGAERRALTEEIARATGRPGAEVEHLLAPPPARTSRNPLTVISQMVRDDVARRRAVASFRREPGLAPGSAVAVQRLVRREVSLSQQARMLDGIHGVFRYWHAAHRPFAIMALVAVCLHVIVAIATGQTWFH